VFLLKVIVRLIDKYFPFLVPTSLLVGMFLGDLIVDLRIFVPWLFAVVTFVGALRIDFNSFRKTLEKPKGIIIVMSILRILMPIWAFIVGRVLFGSDIYTQTGLLLFALIPVGVNSVIWTVL
jgi:predicted Na+-dependent transporter